MLSKNVQLLNTSCGGVSTRLNRGSPDKPRNLIAQILTNRAIVIFLTNFGPLVIFSKFFSSIDGLPSKSENRSKLPNFEPKIMIFFLLKLYWNTLLSRTNYFLLKNITPSFGQKMYFDHQSSMLPLNYRPENFAWFLKIGMKNLFENLSNRFYDWIF